MSAEGYIKFEAVWQQTAPFPWSTLATLDHYRQLMCEHQLIGVYPDGIGFGNISQRDQLGSTFLITGSATGQFPQLSAQHYCRVEAVDLALNRIWCTGPIIASSESMSHAVIYQTLPWVGAVIHAHHRQWWEQLLHRIPTTAAQATYGTPAMAYSIIDLLTHTDLPTQGLFVMEGHPEGLFAFGKDLAEAAAKLLNLF